MRVFGARGRSEALDFPDGPTRLVAPNVCVTVGCNCHHFCFPSDWDDEEQNKNFSRNFPKKKRGPRRLGDLSEVSH